MSTKKKRRKKITEESGVHPQWYARAQKMTLDQVPAFLKELTETYDHDYGTVCHAVAAGALAAAAAMHRSPAVGGITGFQASCVLWSFAKAWMQWGDEPRCMLNYDNILYPQYEDTFTTISPEIWQWIQAQARAKLKDSTTTSASPAVRAHWQAIVSGAVPFGLRVQKR